MLISDDGEIIAGHGRVRAAELLGLREVPTLRLSHLGEKERRAYVLAIDLPDINPIDLPINSVLQAILEKVFKIKPNNGALDTQVTGMEALIQRIYKSSNDGNALSQKLMLEYALRLEKKFNYLTSNHSRYGRLIKS